MGGFAQWETTWSPAQQEFCCSTMGRGCTTALPETTPTVPPTPFPTPPPTPPTTWAPTQPTTRPPAPSGPVDPFNCAVDPENTWQADKKEWCCRIHHVGCPSTAPPQQPIILPAPMPIAPPAKPYDCNAGFANWMAGWSVAKKAWCCSNEGKGCPPAAGGCA